MTAITLDGVATATAIKNELRERIEALATRGIVPGLGTLLVGEDPGSVSYVSSKHRDCAEVGITSIPVQLPAGASEAEVRSAVAGLNADPSVTGYIVQLPLPKGIDENAILELIDPDKDADGLHPTNLGRLVLGVEGDLNSPLPCTPAGVVELLRRYDVPIAGKHVVIVGRGLTVGRPLGLVFTRKGIDATVTLTHSRTVDLPDRSEARRHRGGRDRRAALRQARVDQARSRGSGCRGHPGRHDRLRQGATARRRRPGRGGDRGLDVAQPGRSRTDDACPAAEQRRGCCGAPERQR